MLSMRSLYILHLLLSFAHVHMFLCMSTVDSIDIDVLRSQYMYPTFSSISAIHTTGGVATYECDPGFVFFLFCRIIVYSILCLSTVDSIDIDVLRSQYMYPNVWSTFSLLSLL